ncbi:MAG: RsmE family RNA methyltransferase [Candidatus Omnitrophota bacterium]
MHRFFAKNFDKRSQSIRITDPSEIHHIKDVLRLSKGHSVMVFDGKGQEAECEILKVENTCITLDVKKFTESKTRTTPIILACALPKKAKFETIIEKCTELGVSEIIPLETKRTEVTLKGERAQQKLKRYQTVALNAAKQSQRKTVPVIRPITLFKDALNLITPKDASFIPCLTQTRKSIAHIRNHIANTSGQIIFFIGPEGDFTKEEVSLAIQKGCLPISLGPTTLKVDTAAICVVAFAQFSLLS